MESNLLIVEDHEAARDLILHALEGGGYQLEFASSGTEAVEILQRGRSFTTALLDVSLPGVSGLDICRRMKSDSLLRTTPVILMSGALGARELAQESVRVGADAFLAKPFSLDELRTVVRAFTRIREQAIEIDSLRSKLDESQAELSASQTADTAVNLDWRLPYHDFMRHARKKYFLHALALAGGNKSRLARKSGLDRSTLYVHFRNLGMLPEQKKPAAKPAAPVTVSQARRGRQTGEEGAEARIAQPQTKHRGATTI
ncbi:MAG: response regulator, partial [Candidatus Binatia bacterium]